MATAPIAPPLSVALLGCGTVGAEVARLLHERAGLLAGRIGRPLQLVGVAVRDASRDRQLPGLAPTLLTDDAGSLLGADIVVEVMGGVERAGELVQSALERGRAVVTANKQLIAAHGPRLHRLADAHGGLLAYEAAVVAAVPVLRVVRESLAGDRIETIAGILNGSTNYVLDAVARHGISFEEALAQAGERGYLEADPTEDLSGLDAAAKILILARQAWGCDLTLDDVRTEGISGLTDADIETARGTGTVIKLVASARRSGEGSGARYELAVRPVALAQDHPLATVRGGGNGLVIETVSAGTLELYGAGAGGEETASAVLGDIVDVARDLSRA